jgi:hypothetical protein
MVGLAERAWFRIAHLRMSRVMEWGKLDGIGDDMRRISRTAASGMLATLLTVVGCSESPFQPGPGLDPRALEGVYAWEFERWAAGSPEGFPVVELSWELPTQHRNEAFRVYARSGGSGYGLIATVTACSGGVCRYSDTNVIGGRSYDYFVVTVDERDGAEIGSTQAIRIDVPVRPALATPGAPTAIGLDGAAYLTWPSTGVQRYFVLVEPEGDDLFLIGETDGLSFFDGRALNGIRYRYHVAGVDAQGHVSSLSAGSDAFPRPDFHADIVFAHADHPTASGFRFVTDETQDPIVPGAAVTAQWRLEVVNGDFRIRPLGETAVTPGTFTTQLTCGPGSDANCVDIRFAPQAAQFGIAPVSVETGNTYVFRVVATDGRTHFAKVRAQGTTVDSQGRRLMVFDWAYQLRPDERNLNLMR